MNTTSSLTSPGFELFLNRCRGCILQLACQQQISIKARSPRDANAGKPLFSPAQENLHGNKAAGSERETDDNEELSAAVSRFRLVLLQRMQLVLNRAGGRRPGPARAPKVLTS